MQVIMIWLGITLPLLTYAWVRAWWGKKEETDDD